LSKEHIYLGQSGEEVAIDLLKKNGYKILVKNYRTKLGEIDIVARDKDTTCFIEVKTRQTEKFGLPQEAILRSKQKKISKVAIKFLKDNNLLDKKARFDVVSVMYKEGIPKIDLIKNAFELEGEYAL